jgi:hypothetical protein
MSLINDALKRAREAQQQAPPPPSSQLQFRPVEPSQHARHGLGLMLPAALAGVALLALLFVWQLSQKRNATGPGEVKAITARATQATTAPEAPMPPAVAASEPTPTLAPQPKPLPEPASSPSPVTVPAVALATNAPATIATVQETEAPKAPALTPPPRPKPAPLRLQAIVFSPTRPSAMVSGKTLFIGDKLGDYRVKAIDKGSLTLVGAGLTNVLTLSE